jgi:hypothetical protein
MAENIFNLVQYCGIIQFRIKRIKGEAQMADRKQFLNTKPADPKLVSALEAARNQKVTEEELHEQRISFAFGNAPASSTLITKESVRLASKKISIRS